MQILLKLYRCFVHGLKICMWFGYNSQIIFVTFVTIEIFSGVLTGKVNRLWVPCVCNSTHKYMLILLKLYRCEDVHVFLIYISDYVYLITLFFLFALFYYCVLIWNDCVIVIMQSIR